MEGKGRAQQVFLLESKRGLSWIFWGQLYSCYRTRASISSAARRASCWDSYWVLVQDLPSAPGNCVTQGLSPFQGTTCTQWLVNVKEQSQCPLFSVRQLCRPALQSSPTPELREDFMEISVTTRSPLSFPASSSAWSSDHCLTDVPRALSLKIPVCWSQSHSLFCRKAVQEKGEIK